QFLAVLAVDPGVNEHLSVNNHRRAEPDADLRLPQHLWRVLPRLDALGRAAVALRPEPLRPVTASRRRSRASGLTRRGAGGERGECECECECGREAEHREALGAGAKRTQLGILGGGIELTRLRVLLLEGSAAFRQKHLQSRADVIIIRRAMASS